MSNYPWAVNPSKLQRAIAMAGGKGEEAVKENYIKLGGKVLESKGSVNAAKPAEEAVKEKVDKEPVDEKSDETIKDTEDEKPVVEKPLVVAKKRRLKSIP